MLDLDGAIDDRFENEIDRAVENLKKGCIDKSYFIIGNRILQAAYDKYFKRTKDSFLKAKCLRNLSKSYFDIGKEHKCKEYSKILYELINIEDRDFKEKQTVCYCLSMNEYSQTFKNELSKEELIKIEKFNLSFYQKDLESNYYNAMMAQSNIYLLEEKYEEILRLLKDIHTNNHPDADEVKNEIINDLETSNEFYYRQAKDLINQSNSLQVV